MQELVSKDLKCFKYNYALDDVVQNFSNYDATIRLSDDYERLIITNLKPNPKDVFTKQDDPEEVQKAKYIDKIV
jgi:hypothetical protein